MKNKLLNSLKLCLLTNSNQPRSIKDYTTFIHEVIGCGVTMIQLRDKSDDLQYIKKQAVKLHKILRNTGIPLIINDHVEVAAKIGEGVHVGQKDIAHMPISKIRALIGPDKIIGLSIESMEQLEEANKMPDLDYVTASAVFPSSSKPDCIKIWGLEGLTELVKNSLHPITAIGGINDLNICEVMQAGAIGVAVIGAIHDNHDPASAAFELRKGVDDFNVYGS